MADGSNPGWELRKSSKEHRGEYFFNKFSKETVWVKEWDVEKRGPPPDTGPPLPSQRISHSGSDSAGPSGRSGSSKRRAVGQGAVPSGATAGHVAVARVQSVQSSASAPNSPWVSPAHVQRSMSLDLGQPSVGTPLVPGFGNAWLDQARRERHQNWALGGVAELVHNSVDAKATSIKIMKFPSRDSKFDDPHFGLRFDDNGVGMTQAELVTMLSMHADTDYSKKKDRVGGYGVGFKAGSIALAQTAVVLSWKTTNGTRALSIGVLSNEPYESRNEAPTRLYVSIDARTDEPIGESTDEDYMAVREAIDRVNRRLPKMLAEWLDEDRTGPHGTSVLLLGFRSGERLFDFERDPHDAVLTSQTSRTGLHPGNKSREAGDAVPMDSSLRSFLSLMFLHRDGHDFEISLFGQPVERVKHWESLKEATREKQTIEWAYNGETHPIEIMLGEQTNETKLHGCMLYFEGALISSYARTFANLIKVKPREERDRFGAVLVVNLLKKHGFSACPEKISFRRDEKTDPFWVRLKSRFDSKIDSLMTLREKRRPERGLFRQVLTGIKGRLCSLNSAIRPQGPLRGVLFPVPDEECSEKNEDYNATVSEKIALSDVENKVDAGEYDRADVEQSVKAFRRDVELVFTNAIKWHSTGRWIPDTVDDLDVNECTQEDIAAAQTKPFVTTKHIYTLRAIFKHRSVPVEFKDVTISNQQHRNITTAQFKRLWDPAKNKGFAEGTSILLPHRQDVQAVTQAKELMEFAAKSADDVVKELRKLKQPPRRAVEVDHWITCDQCHIDRRCTPEQAKRFGGDGVLFQCSDIGVSCGGQDESQYSSAPLTDLVHYETSTMDREDSAASSASGRSNAGARRRSDAAAPLAAATVAPRTTVKPGGRCGDDREAVASSIMAPARSALESLFSSAPPKQPTVLALLRKALEAKPMEEGNVIALAKAMEDYGKLSRKNQTEDISGSHDEFKTLDSRVKRYFPEQSAPVRQALATIRAALAEIDRKPRKRVAPQSDDHYDSQDSRDGNASDPRCDKGSAAASSPASKRRRQDRSSDLDSTKQDPHSKKKGTARKLDDVPMELAPASLKHYPDQVNAAAKSLRLDFRVSPCSRHRSARHPCHCGSTWNAFANRDPDGARQVKARVNENRRSDITASQGGVAPSGPENKKNPCPPELGQEQREHYPTKVANAAANLHLYKWRDRFKSMRCSRGTGVPKACNCSKIWNDLARDDPPSARRLTSELKKRRETEIRGLQGLRQND
eukprot:m.334646 g.334646  ORF g.334646 m.334646 type:complete len:1251 (+) comp16529_c0_seq16:348-4100(+)